MAKNKRVKFENVGRYFLSALILLTSLGMLALMASQRKAPEETETDDLIQTVAVFPAKRFDGTLEIRVTGAVEPHREIEMASQVAGNVVEKSPFCRAGNYVTADTELLKVDSLTYQLAVERLLAEKAQAQASLVELEQELANVQASIQLAEREYKLQQKDFERKMRAGSALAASERDEAKRSLTAAERQMTEMKNSRKLIESRRARTQSAIDLSEVGLKEARLNVERCVFRAPFDGVIVTDLVEKGDFVSTGETVLVIEDTSRVDVACNLRFEQLQQIVKYQIPDSRYTRTPFAAYQLPPTPVDVVRRAEDGTQITWPAMLSRFDGIGVDAQTKMIPCRIVVDEPVVEVGEQHKALVRGMFVHVTIPLSAIAEPGKEILVFPAVALQPGNQVWSVVDGRLRRHQVEVLDRKNIEDADPEKRLVVVRVDSDTLGPGDKIVVSPLPQPIVGTQVKLVEQSSADDSEPDVGNENGSHQQVSSSPEGKQMTESIESSTSEAARQTGDPANAQNEKGVTRS